MSAEPPALPRALDDDDDDVAWALQTAAVQWERGGVADAIVWLKRAAEAAIEAGNFGRSADIQRRANELDRWLKAQPAFPVDDGDDGVDELLAAEAPEIEAGGLDEPTQSLVDMLEAEDHGGHPSAAIIEDVPLDDLGDLEDEDIVELDDDVEEARDLDGYEELMDETTHARSEVSRALIEPEPLPRPSGRPRRPATERPAKPANASSRPAPVRHEPEPEPEPTGEYQLPPPPIPRIPPRAPAPEASAPRQPFAPEPETQPSSERPVVIVDGSEEPARPRVESLPEVSATELDAPTVEPPPPSVEPPPPSIEPPPPAPRVAPMSEAAPSELDAAVEALLETPPPPPILDVALIAACPGLEDLPPETQAELALRARVETLAPDQEVSGFGLALVVRGHVVVMPTIAEGACGYAQAGEPVFSRGTLAEGVSLRVVALEQGAEVAVWQTDAFEQVLETCPWVADELRVVADRFQALAGAAMGPLGERLDDHMRSMLTDRCELRVLFAGDVLLEEAKPVDGLYIVGGGRLELVTGGAVSGELGPGDLPFASAVLTHAPAGATVRAGAGGALVLHADRMATHELLVSVPPLLELLSMV